MKTSFWLEVLWLGLALVAGFFVAQSPHPVAEVPSFPEEISVSEVPKESIHGRKGVYLTAYAAANPLLFAQVIEKSREFGLNAVVVDVKNNNGEVCYSTQVPLAKAIGAVRPVLDLGRLVEELHGQGFYVIARQVVFYDPLLAKHLGSSTAPWVLPTVDVALAYNLAIAQEVERAKVDEIQFDYVRFPDDGPIGPDYSWRCAAVDEFLRLAQEALSIPISVDVYGRVMWPWNSQKIDPIGQCLETMARYVQLISPMLYPSHFVEPELKYDPYGTVFRTMNHGKSRVSVPLRPYLQAFSMDIPAGMSLPVYILAQIRAAEASGADGYLFWNPRGDYAALWEALAVLAQEKERL